MVLSSPPPLDSIPCSTHPATPQIVDELLLALQSKQCHTWGLPAVSSIALAVGRRFPQTASLRDSGLGAAPGRITFMPVPKVMEEGDSFP